MKTKPPIVLAVMLLALWKASAEDAFDKPGIVKIAIETQITSKAIPDRSPGTWLAAKVSEGDKVFTGATVYFRGHGTEGKLDKSPNLTIKFDSTDPAKQFHGHQTILLENALNDRTYACDYIGSELFRSAGVPAPHVTYANITFNGTKLGLYVMVEGIDHAFLEHRRG